MSAVKRVDALQSVDMYVNEPRRDDMASHIDVLRAGRTRGSRRTCADNAIPVEHESARRSDTVGQNEIRS